MRRILRSETFGILAPAIAAYLVGAWCAVALAWDGSGYLFNALQSGEPNIAHHRYSNYPTLAAVVWAGRFVGDPWLLGQLYSLLVALTPLGSLALSLWFLRGKDLAPLRLWPVLGILLCALPGEICLMSEASLAVQVFWPILAFIAGGVVLSGAPWVLLLGIYAFFLHPTIALLFLLASVLCAAMAFARRDVRGRAVAWSGVFLAFAIARILFSVLTASVYERAEFGWEPNWLAFIGSLCGIPALLLIGLYAFGLVFLGEAAGRIPFAKAWRITIWVAGGFLLLGLVWAANSWIWAGAIGYRRFVLVCSLPLMVMGAVHWFLLRRSSDEGRFFQAAPIASLIFAVIFSVQALSWRGDVLRLQAALEEASPPFLFRNEQPWMKGRPVDHWSSSMLSAIVQGKKPRVLYAESPAHVVGADIQLFPGGWLYARDGWFLLAPESRSR